ncbi:hypothetical protein F4778DRAFT_779812 [Xylariomycetidae sp. FL2044]|nr:hypothetical protein F4778DRAFT_779812 [Xylariomycetidae sp. FL2044]
MSSDDDTNGWIHVRGKGRRTQNRNHPKLHPANTPNSQIRPDSSLLTVADVAKEHTRIVDQWKTSTCFRQLKDLVTSEAKGTLVTRALCLGLGTFDPTDGAWQAKRKAHVQLAAFLCIVEGLEQASQQKIPCLFQEPLFNLTDRDFLRSLGHETVQSPEGFDMVDGETFVFGVHLYRDIYSLAISEHIPVIFVGTPYDTWENFYGASDLDWPRMREIDQRCKKVKFPKDDHYTTFSNTTIHWRRPDET